MNNEIKLMLNIIKDVSECKEGSRNGLMILSCKDYKTLLDYITNLQQEIEKLNDDKRGMLVQLYKANDEKDKIKQENERLKENNQAMQEEMARVWEENERLKDIVVEKDNQIKEMILQKTDYTAVNILEMKLEDYKSRCEKAMKCIKNKYYKEEYERKGTFANKLKNILQGENNE